MKNFLLYPLCLSMLCCGEGNQNTNKTSSNFLSEYKSLIRKIVQEYKNENSTEKQLEFEELMQAAPVLLTLKKIVDMMEEDIEIKNPENNELACATLNLLKEVNRENIDNFYSKLENMSTDKIFTSVYQVLLENSRNKTTSYKIEGDKKGDKNIKEETISNYFTFDKNDIERLYEKFSKEQKQNDLEFSVTDLLNQYFKDKKYFLSSITKFLVVNAEPHKNLVVKKDRLEQFKGLVTGGAILKFVSCFSCGGHYEEQSSIFNTDLPEWMIPFSVDEFKKGETGNVFVLFEIVKVSDKKIKSLDDNE